MELTITQNGALYRLQHRAIKQYRGARNARQPLTGSFLEIALREKAAAKHAKAPEPGSNHGMLNHGGNPGHSKKSGKFTIKGRV